MGNLMKKSFAVSFITLIVFNLVVAQRVSTVLGNAWTGEVVTVNDSTREITIKYDNKGKSESFTGVLNQGYKITMKDGSSHELKVSEIPIGMRIRVFSKSKEQDSSGTKVKINLISRVDFLGRDEHARLREQLNVAPSISVTLAETKDLPADNPLKLYLAIEDSRVSDSIAEWVKRWNRNAGAKYGSIEVVSDITKADAYLARYRGSNLIVEIMSTATVFLVIPKDDALQVIWKQAVAIDPDQGSSPLIEKELERRMKARKK